MRLDRDAVVSADLDIDADDAAMAHRLEQARVEDQRAAMRDAGLHDHVGPQAPDHLLDADHVLRQLDHRPAHPGEAIDVFHVPAAAEPGGGYRLERLGRVERMLFRRAVLVADGYAALCFVDGEHGLPVHGPAGSADRRPDRWRWRRIRCRAAWCRSADAAPSARRARSRFANRRCRAGNRRWRRGWCWRRRRRCRSAAGPRVAIAGSSRTTAATLT